MRTAMDTKFAQVKELLVVIFSDFGRIPSYNLMLIDNGWYLILENITCGYGNPS